MSYKQFVYQDIRMGYTPLLSKASIMDWLLCSEQYYIKRYMVFLRKEEYYSFVSPNKLLKCFWARKKNKLGVKLGFFIPAGCFGPDLMISHYGSVIVNPHSRIGSECTIHGNCCIGNKGGIPNDNDSPVIGNNVNIGQGAQILGPVSIADGVVIGAGAVVVKDIYTPNAVVVGVPAKLI